MQIQINHSPKSLFLLVFTLILIFGKACGKDDPISIISIPDPTPEPIPAVTLVDILANDDKYSTLVSLVPQNILDALATDELTVFAPTNEAFNEIPEEILGSLTEEQVVTILLYHVVGGTTLAADIPSQTDAETLLGERLLLQSNNGVFVNGTSEVIDANLTADNGVVHGIDQVLLPSDIRKALDIPNIVDVAEEAGGFETLLSALESTGLTTTVQFLSPFTVFAPTDEAFSALPEGTIASLSKEQLTEILTYHVIGSAVFSGDLQTQQAAETLSGEAIYIVADNSGVTVNGRSNVVAADVEATNGVIHVVDSVLLPDSYGSVVDNAIKRYDFSTLVGAVVNAELAEALMGEGPFTVFAPTNQAFANLPDGLLASLSIEDLQEILLYHVIGSDIKSGDLASSQAPESLSGEALYVTVDDDGVVINGSSNVIVADVNATNGTIHAIDRVLLPNRFQNVVDIAQKNFDLTTLVDLVIEADLASTLAGDGPFTIFAPINSAFEEISDVLGTLSSNDIVSILTYHVVSGDIQSSDIPAGTTKLVTLNGEEMTIVNEGGTVTADGATVITVDLAGSNGVIHLIDSVILPSTFQ